MSRMLGLDIIPWSSWLVLLSIRACALPVILSGNDSGLEFLADQSVGQISMNKDWWRNGLQISVVLTSDPASVGQSCVNEVLLSRLPPAALDIYPWRKLIPNRELGEIKSSVLSCTHDEWSYHLAEVGKREDSRHRQVMVQMSQTLTLLT